MKSHINIDAIKKARTEKNLVQTLKDTALMAYAIFTLLAAYSAIMVYAGTQLASAQSGSNISHVVSVHNAPSK